MHDHSTPAKLHYVPSLIRNLQHAYTTLKVFVKIIPICTLSSHLDIKSITSSLAGEINHRILVRSALPQNNVKIRIGKFTSQEEIREVKSVLAEGQVPQGDELCWIVT